MAEVMVVTHRGQRAALPVAHVRSVVLSLPAGAQTAELWPGDGGGDLKWAHCQSSGFELYLPCESAVVARFLPSEVFELTPVIGDALSLAHVVGVAPTSTPVVWLVDLARLGSPGA